VLGDDTKDFEYNTSKNDYDFLYPDLDDPVDDVRFSNEYSLFLTYALLEEFMCFS
jgi:hypothetical protein